MPILISAIIILIVAFLGIYLVESIAMPPRFNMLFKVVIVLIALLLILQRAGLI